MRHEDHRDVHKFKTFSNFFTDDEVASLDCEPHHLEPGDLLVIPRGFIHRAHTSGKKGAGDMVSGG